MLCVEITLLFEAVKIHGGWGGEKEIRKSGELRIL